MTNNFNLSENLHWPKAQREDIFFQPRKRKVKVRGCDTGFKALFRELDGKTQPISVVGPNYKLIPNDRLHRIVEELDSMPLVFNPSISGSRNNKRFNLVYDLQGHFGFGADSQDGGKLNPQLVVRNSYDGSSQLEVLFGLFRLVCSNMLVIPVHGSIARFQVRHTGKHNLLKRRIHSFLASTLSEEVFAAVNRKVLKAKESDEPKVVSYDFFQDLPNKMLYPILAGIRKFSSIPVSSFDPDIEISYDLNSEKSQLEMVNRIWKERTKPDQKRSFDPEEKLSEYSSLSYNEKVVNQWQLFNLVLKIAQYTVEKNRRIAVAAQIGTHFL